ncbi:hypothetical protein B0A48_11934 [Cryoendolithus antarcticus]|uniref:Glycosyl hydrolase family 32 N-terminal domain-containing protein n=1 Tax=Cryoendolithus antarcticus TaxID=1507870 RepID=A0A1V8STJ3_9PEZI|nr:hypothetical protein B0A48_11934 [Cryoendolithus antarcticus]
MLTSHLIVAFLSLHFTAAQATYSNTSSSATSLPFSITPDTVEGDPNYTAPIFPILPFNQYAGNPILAPNPASNFESAYLYNPTAIVLNETIFLLYRAQNESKVSSVGLAWSTDGTTFRSMVEQEYDPRTLTVYDQTRLNRPIIYATEPWEQGGGTEDPRIVRVNGTFYVTYTAYNLTSAQLCLATSTDLLTWTKYPPLFPNWQDVAFSDIDVPSPRFNHSKSAAIVNEKIDGVYNMYWGDSSFYHATSPDMLNWTTLSAGEPFASGVHPWENRLIEPGPAPIKTRDNRWILVYNGMTTGRIGYPAAQYGVGQMLIDPSRAFLPTVNTSIINPVTGGTYQPAIADGPVARIEKPMVFPSTELETNGQVGRVTFAEGLVQFKGKWWLYYGMADSYLGVAIADVQA